MSRISKVDVNRALDQAGQRLIDAAGKDQRLSRADLQQALGSVEGTEQALVDQLSRFIRHREPTASSVVTVKDVERAIAYAKEKLIARYDANHNGLSNAEIAKMSTTGKLAVQLARELAAVEPAPEPAPEQEGFVREGLSFYELRQGVTIDSEARFTTAEGVNATRAQQFINACHTSTYTDVKSLADAFGAVDGGEFVVRDFTDPANGKQYTAVDYGAGDSTYGAIFEKGSTTIVFAIHDGELMAP